MAQKETLDKIKQYGYWEFQINPADVYTPNLIPKTTELKQILLNNIVHLRGWDFPHISQSNEEDQDFYAISSGIESWINWRHYIEVTRYLQNGLFIFLKALPEDWYEKGPFGIPTTITDYAPKKYLHMIATIYEITEFFTFLSNLCRAGVYKDNLKVKITLQNTLGRTINTFDVRRHLFQEYTSKMVNISFVDDVFTINELQRDYADLSRKYIIKLFNYFNWDDPSPEMIRTDQDELFKNKNIY